MKSLVWVGMFVGSMVGSFVPALWGAGVFSFSSFIFGVLGAILGIWFCYQLGRW